MTLEEFKQQFDSFDEQPLAKGGQKLVFKARHPKYGDVVVKILDSYDERSIREINIVKDNDFNHVPKIYDVVDVNVNGGDTKVIIEQLVDGIGLRQIIDSGKTYTLKEAVDFLEQSLNFINQISEKNIIHRDIKPENIIVADNGELFFLDFGIARILGATSITETNQGGPNTPGYSAPEQFTGQKDRLDTRADLFSIGVVTYELITGKNPFRENAVGVYEILNNTITITPVQHQLKGDKQSSFMGLVAALMSKQIFPRPKNAQQALEWLDKAKTTFAEGD
jgi:serine/threonine-protein kinase